MYQVYGRCIRCIRCTAGVSPSVRVMDIKKEQEESAAEKATEGRTKGDIVAYSRHQNILNHGFSLKISFHRKEIRTKNTLLE